MHQASADSQFVPAPSVVAASDKFLAEIEAQAGLPEWVTKLAGPFQAYGARQTMAHFLSDAPQLVNQRWAANLLGDGFSNLQNMVVPSVFYDEEAVPTIRFQLLLVDTDDTLRMGRAQVSKDPELSTIPQKHIVNTPDVVSWRQQRGHLADVFIPSRAISKSVSTLENMADVMVSQWRKPENTIDGVLDVRAWMHHTALAMFINCMMGDDRAYGPAPADERQLNLADGDEDMPFEDTTPANSAGARGIYNLESTGRESQVSFQDRQLRVMNMAAFANKLLARAHTRAQNGGIGGPLIDPISEIDDLEVKMQNMFATLIAGHDTTAYTMQFCLMELARNQPLQERVREEISGLLHDVERRGSPLTYADLPRFELLTRCICETLRLWTVAGIVFGRVTTTDDVVKGQNGEDVKVPIDTKFTFYNYVHHHSTALWGDDVMHFNPDRKWEPQELQRLGDPGARLYQSTARTPCTARFHPFSVPARDCLGKNFALTEMRVLIARILRSFRIQLPNDSVESLGSVLPHVDHPLYQKWVREIGGPPQPHHLNLKLVPLKASSRL